MKEYVVRSYITQIRLTVLAPEDTDCDKTFNKFELALADFIEREHWTAEVLKPGGRDEV